MSITKGICPEAEDGIHECDLDFTDHVFGTYRGVQVDGDTIIVDTTRYKTWDSDMELHSLKCDFCGEEIEWEDRRYEMIWE